MWNFQKEVVLNSLDNVKVVEGTDKGLGKPAIDKKVRFHDGGEYFAKYIVDHKIYETDPIDPVNFTLSIHPADNELLGQHIQILIELGLDNDYRGDYGSALWYFRKPILIDVILPEDRQSAAAVIAEAIETAIPVEYRFVEVSYNKGDNSVVIKGSDSYQKVRKVVISRYECEDRCGNGSEEPVEIVNVSTGALKKGNSYVTYTPNNVEFGTYEYLLHNLRLPTYANLRFTSPSAPEMPVPGVKYTQFSFAYCVPRGIHFGGLSVAGQTNHSTTLHTFFVASTLVENFKKLFKGIGFVDDDFEPIGRNDGQHEITILPDAYASSQDLANAAAIKANSDADTKLAEKVQANTEKNTEQDSSIAAKANAADVYTKSEVYQKSETYSQSEADAKFQAKA